MVSKGEDIESCGKKTVQSKVKCKNSFILFCNYISVCAAVYNYIYNIYKKQQRI